MNSRFVSYFAAITGVLALAGCQGSSDTTAATPGPIDGTYIETSTPSTCDSAPETLRQDALTLSGATFTLVETGGGGCNKTNSGGVTYSGTNGITVTQTSQICGSGCSGANCTTGSATQAAQVGTYSLSGNTLTLSFTNSNCSCNGSSCPSTGSDTEVDGGFVKQ